jgi:hypothetical protein
MSAKRLFEDDDFLFADPSSDRASHVELRVDRGDEPPPTQPEMAVAGDYFRRVPRLAITPRELTLLPLDHREGFILSRVDGTTTVETILDLCAMPSDEALAILESLVERGVLTMA